jgi:hypothetical protein
MDPTQSMKAIIAVVVSAVGALIAALAGFGSDASIGDLDAKTWLIALGAVLASGGLTWWCENIRGVAGTVTKAIVAFLSAGVATLVVALDDKVITQAEYLTAFSAAVVATGFVYQADGPTHPATEVDVVRP